MNVGWIEIVNIIIIFQLLVFTAFLFVKKSPFVSNYILGIHLFAQAAGIFYGICILQAEFFLVNNPHLLLVGYPFVFLWGPSFYLYVKSIVYKDYKIRWLDLLHLIPFVLLMIFFSVTFYFYGAETKRIIFVDSSYIFFSQGRLFDVFLRVQILVYIIKSFGIYSSVRKRLKENYSSISKTNLSWLTFVLVGYTICYLISVAFIYTEYYLQTFNKYLLLGNYLQFFIYFNIIFFKAWDQPEIFKVAEDSVKYKRSKLGEDESINLVNQIERYISENKPYLNPELTLNQLAEEIKIHPRILSQVINECFNQNFYDYINKLRIEESKRMLVDFSLNKNILETLYETGFNSKATFNRVFKKETGLSPTEYRKQFIKELQ